MEWGAAHDAANRGQLLAFLAQHACDVRAVEPEHSVTLLHLAAESGDVEATLALLARGAVVDSCDEAGWTPACVAAAGGHVRVLELLCAAGADLHAAGGVVWCALVVPHGAECVRVLVANGVRLHALDHKWASAYITPELEAFERGVLACRAMVVALLGLKRRRPRSLQHVDKYLVRLLALAIWCARWQWP